MSVLITILIIVHLLLVYPVYRYIKWLQLYDFETKKYVGKWTYGNFYTWFVFCLIIWELVLLLGSIIHLVEYVENKWNEEIPS